MSDEDDEEGEYVEEDQEYAASIQKSFGFFFDFVDIATVLIYFCGGKTRESYQFCIKNMPPYIAIAIPLLFLCGTNFFPIRKTMTAEGGLRFIALAISKTLNPYQADPNHLSSYQVVSYNLRASANRKIIELFKAPNAFCEDGLANKNSIYAAISNMLIVKSGLSYRGAHLLKWIFSFIGFLISRQLDQEEGGGNLSSAMRTVAPFNLFSATQDLFFLLPFVENMRSKYHLKWELHKLKHPKKMCRQEIYISEVFINPGKIFNYLFFIVNKIVVDIQNIKSKIMCHLPYCLVSLTIRAICSFAIPLKIRAKKFTYARGVHMCLQSNIVSLMQYYLHILPKVENYDKMIARSKRIFN